MRLGIADHLGWAVAVTASADHQVVDRRRIELIEAGLPTAPIEHDVQPLDDAAAAALVAEVRASAVRATARWAWRSGSWGPGPTRCCTARGRAGPPWAKDHRRALAAAVTAGRPAP